MPGDPVTILANELRSTQGISEADAMSRAISMLNYDPSQPLLQQIGHFILQLLKGDLGTSIRFRTPVLSIVLSALPWTLFSWRGDYSFLHGGYTNRFDGCMVQE